jgi:DNA-binding NarL/FixJ family response regulator
VICDLDRQLIEAHIARKGVTIVATGVYGLDPYAPPPCLYSALHATRAKRVALRRAEVRTLVEKGVTQDAIAEAMNVCVSTINGDVRALKDEGRLPPGYPRGERHG